MEIPIDGWKYIPCYLNIKPRLYLSVIQRNGLYRFLLARRYAKPFPIMILAHPEIAKKFTARREVDPLYTHSPMETFYYVPANLPALVGFHIEKDAPISQVVWGRYVAGAPDGGYTEDELQLILLPLRQIKKPKYLTIAKTWFKTCGNIVRTHDPPLPAKPIFTGDNESATSIHWHRAYVFLTEQPLQLELDDC